MWRLLGNVANWRPLRPLPTLVSVRGHIATTRRVSEKVNSRLLDYSPLQDLEAIGSFPLYLATPGEYQAVLRQSIKGRLQRPISASEGILAIIQPIMPGLGLACGGWSTPARV